MAELTIEIDEDAMDAIRQVADARNLSTEDFVRIAIAQSLARTLKDPRLEERASRATGDGWARLKQAFPDVPPIPGDEMR